MAFQLPFTHTTIIISLFIFLSLLTTPSHSATTTTLNCSSLKLNRTYDNCTNLPTLGATLHFTFNAPNRSLSVAFSAAPPSPSGWVAWGLNLAGGGMIGAEAIIALPSSSAAPALHRYNLTAYKGIDEVKAFSFDSWDLFSQDANGVITIFAVVKIPETAAKNVSHVWQVGPASGGKPGIHEIQPANLQAKAALPVPLAGSTSSSPPTASGESANAPANGDNKKNGAAAGERLGVGFFFGVVLALMVGVLFTF